MKPTDLFKTHPLLSDRVRLAIMAVLAASEEPVSFTELAEKLQLTRGNLSSHMQKLESENLIEVKKEFVDRKPSTTYSCTKLGRTEIKNYLVQIEELLKKV
jgi:DNA-binding transcriptional ArsR family regulator